MTKVKTLHKEDGTKLDIPAVLDAIGGKLGSPQNVLAWQNLAKETTPADYPPEVVLIVKKDGNEYRQATGEGIANGLALVEELATATAEAEKIIRQARMDAKNKTAEISRKFARLIDKFQPPSSTLHGYEPNATKKALATLQATHAPTEGKSPAKK